MSWESETLFPLVEASNYLPKRRGKKVHVSTLFRWVSRGVSGVHLETCKVGGIRYTSLEALRRFRALVDQGDVSRCSQIDRLEGNADRTESILKRHGLSQ